MSDTDDGERKKKQQEKRKGKWYCSEGRTTPFYAAIFTCITLCTFRGD